MDDAISAARVSAAFQYVMVVFPPGIPAIRSWAFWGLPQAKSYVLLDNAIGAWAMELLHMVTEFGDLYGPPSGRSPTPGAYDEMDTAGATHPSVFTKLRMGWLDASTVTTIIPQHAPSSFTLHPLALLQPAPPGRTSAIRIPIVGSATRYLLIEARESLDAYESTTATIGSGISNEGVVVFDVEESVWPPLWLRTNPALRVGDAFNDAAFQIELRVDSHIAGGGFRVSVVSSEPARCNTIRIEIESIAADIVDLQADLKGAAPGAKARIAGQIKRAKTLLAALKQEAASLHCRL